MPDLSQPYLTSCIKAIPKQGSFYAMNAADHSADKSLCYYNVTTAFFQQNQTNIASCVFSGSQAASVAIPVKPVSKPTASVKPTQINPTVQHPKMAGNSRITGFQGQAIWKAIHNLMPPSLEGVKEILKLMGCNPCLSEAQAYVDENPPDCSSLEAYQFWSFKWHNHVHDLIGQPEYALLSAITDHGWNQIKLFALPQVQSYLALVTSKNSGSSPNTSQTITSANFMISATQPVKKGSGILPTSQKP
jgi:hypothetical protein